MLSVNLRRQGVDSLLICQGDAVGGKESDYLFHVLTREDKGDVILDLQGVKSFDNEGLSVIILSYELLASRKRRLFLKSPSIDIIRALQQHQMTPIPDSVKTSAAHFCGKGADKGYQSSAGLKPVTEKVM